MRKVEEILGQMDKILNMLIDNAEKLLELSLRVIAEEELGPLQKRQEELMDELIVSDEAFHQECQGAEQDYHSPLRTRINEKLEKFETLNTSFIDNITSTHGLIHFEKGSLKKRVKK